MKKRRSPDSGPGPSTRERIMREALAEFSRAGYSGARVDRIAAKARISKGMIYYHFRTKDDLFAAVLESAWNRGHILAQAPDHPVDSILFWSEFYLRNREWTRLLGWEGLEWRKPAVVAENERRAFWQSAVKKMKSHPGPGGWPEFLDQRHYLITLIAIEIVPILLPQLCRMITGQHPDDPVFRRERAKFLRGFAQFVADRRAPRPV
jgi:AcrR family transcriptional regulator